MRFLSTMAALLTGCVSPKPVAPEPPPDKPGTSVPIQYPIVALEVQPPNIRTFDNEEVFTTSRLDSNFAHVSQPFIDSGAGLFEAIKVYQIEKPPNPIFDMGRTPFRVFVKMKREKTVTIDQARAMVIEVMRNPISWWSYTPQRLESSIARVNGFKNVSDLVAACRDIGSWR